jgi:hypothetical protein
MSYSAKIFSLAYNSTIVSEETALKTKLYSVRLIKDSSVLTPTAPSTSYSVLLNGNCMDQENRKLYTFYLDSYFNQGWIFEIDIDTRKQTVVFFDSTNRIGFNGNFKIHNARVVQGRLIWTDNNMPEYQMDVARAKKSFLLGIGYGQYPTVTQWFDNIAYLTDMIVWSGRYFYKCLQDNSNKDPLFSTTEWERLCLVSEAYYSTDPMNYYFAPVPPKFGPSGQYISDNTRKPNNLRQTIWQFAYRYVYMDYRKSTFSPASIPDMPDSEEEIATGLMNELTELNNAIKLRINTGGEEVRKIEIIGRSTQDPSTWYLIDVIDLFDELEGTEYDSVSPISEPLRGDIIITIPLPIVTNIGNVIAGEVALTLSVKAPVVTNIWLDANMSGMVFDASESGIGDAQTVVITTHGGVATVYLSGDAPYYFTVLRDSDSSEVTTTNRAIANGETLRIYPKNPNLGSNKLENLILSDNSVYDNRVTISLQHSPSVITPVVSVAIDPVNSVGMTLTDASGSATIGSNEIIIIFTPHNPLYGFGLSFKVWYNIYQNGMNVGTGYRDTNNSQGNFQTLYMNTVAAPGDVISVLLYEENV